MWTFKAGLTEDDCEEVAVVAPGAVPEGLPDLVRVAHVLLLHVGSVLALQRAGDQRSVELLQLRLDLVDAAKWEGK